MQPSVAVLPGTELPIQLEVSSDSAVLLCYACCEACCEASLPTNFCCPNVTPTPLSISFALPAAGLTVSSILRLSHTSLCPARTPLHLAAVGLCPHCQSNHCPVS